jgi:hypothetical protein
MKALHVRHFVSTHVHTCQLQHRTKCSASLHDLLHTHTYILRYNECDETDGIISNRKCMHGHVYLIISMAYIRNLTYVSRKDFF